MENLGFNSRWRGLMIQCISFVSYSIHINGKPRGNIIPSRGLQQGDPLSSYIYIYIYIYMYILICAEGLSALIKKSVQEGKMEGVDVCRGAPILSHLFFIDYSLIFL